MLSSQTATLVDIALEGAVGGAPKPTVVALSGIFDKVAELQLKAEKEKLKQASQAPTSNRGRGRGRGRGSGARSNDQQGK